MDLVPVTLDPLDSDYIEIVTTADLHIGARTHDSARAARHRQYILDSPNRYTLCLGDDFENNLRSSPGAGVFEQQLSPREQRAYGLRWFAPLVEADALLGFLESNHSFRGLKEADFSYEEWLADTCKTRYFGYHANLKVRVGEQVYTLFATHGSTGASTDGGLLNAVLRLRDVCDAEVYLMGHAHRQLVHETLRVRPDLATNTLAEYRQHFAVAGSFLSYDGSYAAQLNLPRGCPGQISVRLYADCHHAEVVRLAD